MPLTRESDPVPSLPAVILVTGAPAAGKSTLAARLAPALGGRLISLDELKEQLFTESGDSLTGLALRVGAETELERQLREGDPLMVVDIWIQPGRDDARVIAMLRRTVRRLVEVSCRVSPDVAVARFFARQRGGPHNNAEPGLEQRVRAAATDPPTLGLGLSLEVSTEEPVDPVALADAIRDALATSAATRGLELS